MKLKLLSIACISLLLSHAINAESFSTLRLQNSTSQVITANLTWKDLNSNDYVGSSFAIAQPINPNEENTFNTPPNILLPNIAPAYFTITINGQASNYCLMHHDGLDSSINNNDLLQYNGSAILKGSDSVTHTWQYCD